MIHNMKKKITALLVILFVIVSSILIVVLPSFLGKDISHIRLTQELSLKRILDKEQDLELVFFGYAGCRNICTPRLEELGQWYKTLPLQTQSHLGLKFFDLSIPEDNTLPDSFAKAFHEDFEGIHLPKKTLLHYTGEFSVYFSPSLIDEYEIDHSTHLYLVKKDTNGKKYLRFIYTNFPYDLIQINTDIQTLLNE